jgi:hypothetical protein
VLGEKHGRASSDYTARKRAANFQRSSDQSLLAGRIVQGFAEADPNHLAGAPGEYGRMHSENRPPLSTGEDMV